MVKEERVLQVKNICDKDKEEIISVFLNKVIEYIEKRIPDVSKYEISIEAEISDTWPYMVTAEARISSRTFNPKIREIVHKALEEGFKALDEEMAKRGLKPVG